MRKLRLTGEVMVLLSVFWLSVASSDDEGDDSGGGSAEPATPGQPGDPAKACTQDTECAGFRPTDRCSAQERCIGGLCVYQEGVTCQGGTACVTQACDPNTGACVSTPAGDGAYCDDGNFCTQGDQCKAGACVPGQTTVCDDSNPCTNDSCDKLGGCTYQPKTAGTTCAYADKCYQGGTCDESGYCNPGAAKSCDDGNPCTQDWCDSSSGCVNQALGGTGCDDGDPCTVNDSCATGSCAGTPVGEGDLCDDANPCTGGTTCAGGKCGGGVPIGDDGACDDGDPCTEGTVCSEGQCAGGTSVDCPDDGNPCTVESCSPSAGCTATPAPQGTECPASNPCWEKALCEGLECSIGVPKSNGSPCEDGDPCTGGSLCQSGWCSAGTPVGDGAKCDDGNACTVGETCTSGYCGAAGELACDDGNPCTSDWCEPAEGCKSSPVGDGSYCELAGDCFTGASCQAGVCVGTDACDDGDACTVDTCNAGSCKSSWSAAQCPAEASCANGKDDDGDGAADCAQPGCVVVGGAVCDAVNSLPALVTFDTGPGPGFGAMSQAGNPYAFTVDGTPATVTPWSGKATLNFNDGSQAGVSAGATGQRVTAELCCWDPGFASVSVTWMEYVDLPEPAEGAEVSRGFTVIGKSGEKWEFGLTMLPEDRGAWRRRVVPVGSGAIIGVFGARWWIGDSPAPWSGGTGWFIDDVEILAAEDCTNAQDDNGNGKVDCADPLCDLYPACMETACDDGADDNGDGFIDCDDQDCALQPVCQ
ncbi:MAG: hypothetical protein AMXMBFR64_34510 [Myxococcales bacterium]